MTVAEIIAWAKRKKYTTESDANLIIDLAGIQDEIYLELNAYDIGWKYFDIYSVATVADTLNYSIPTDCEPENIITVLVSATTDVTDDAEWYEYKYAGLNDYTGYGNFWGKGGEDGKIALTCDDETIQTTGLTIKVFYYPSPTAIAAGITPDLLGYCHNLFKYALVQSIASQGDNPDINIANYYQAKYNECMDKVKGYLSTIYNSNPTRTQPEAEW